MPESQALTIAVLDVEAYRAAIPELATLIVDAVATGAGANFLEGVTVDEAAGWWRARELRWPSDGTTPFVAFDGERVAGSTLLVRSVNPNSPHRAEIGKVIVLGSARRRGLASALMRAAETVPVARAAGCWSSTPTGTAADAFYRSIGWHETGRLPNYALNPDGQPWAATFFWKDLR